MAAFADWSIIIFDHDSCLRTLWFFQAQGDERQAVFCHKGPKGGKNHHQDSPVCSDLLLWHMRLWEGAFHTICTWLSVSSCNLIALHRMRITTGWHCDAKIGKRSGNVISHRCKNLGNWVGWKDEVSNVCSNFFCRWMQSNTTVN